MIDKPRGQRTAEKVEEDHMEKDKERLTQAQSRKKTIHLAAHIEANICQAHEDKLKHVHNPPPVVIDRVPRPCLASDSEFLELGEGEHAMGSSASAGGDEQEVLDPSDDGTEQPKKRTGKSSRKKGDLREQIKNVGPPPTVVQGNEKRKALDEES